MIRVITRTVGPHLAVFMLVNAVRSGITTNLAARSAAPVRWPALLGLAGHLTVPR